MVGRFEVRAASAGFAALLLMPGAADAIPITGLYNTGVNALGVPLANNAVEQHYSLVSVPSGPTSVRVATAANGFPIPPWLGDNGVSAWIGPTGAADLSDAIGDYDYRTTFQLSALEAAAATIDGVWSVDNTGTRIVLNGVTAVVAALDFQAFYTLSIHNGFVAGVNTLDFIVTNAGGPTGLRTQLGGVIVIPEPVSISLLAAGLCSVLMGRWRSGSVKRWVSADLAGVVGPG